MRGVPGPHGGHPGQKLSAEHVADMMPLVGTTPGSSQWRNDTYWEQFRNPEGKAHFGRRELLESTILKRWFSNQVASFKASWNGAFSKAVNSVNDLPEMVDDEIDDEGGAE